MTVSKTNDLAKLKLPDLNEFVDEKVIVSSIKLEELWISLETFWILLDHVVNEESEVVNVVIKHSTALSTILNKMGKEKLSKLIQKIIEINSDKFGQGKLTEIKGRIISSIPEDQITPSLSIDRGFREIFLSEVRWEPTDESKQLISQFITENSEYLEENYLESLELGVNFGFWNILDLSDLMEMIAKPEMIDNPHFEADKYKKLVANIEELFVQTLLEYNNVFSKKTAFTFIFIDSYIYRGEKTLVSAQELIDNLWSELEEQSQFVYDSTKYIFLAFYSKVINEYFKRSLDFITRRNLIGSIVSKFEEDISSNNEIIQEIFLSHNIHPWVFDKLVQGFIAYCEMIFAHIKELPPCKERSDLLSLIDESTGLIYDLTVQHLCKQYQLTDPQRSIDNFIEEVTQTDLKEWYIKNVFDLIAICTKIPLFISEERIHEGKHQTKIDLWLKSLKITNEVETQFLYELDILLLSGKYPFSGIYQLVVAEIVGDDTLFVSSTFENRIVDVITQILDYLSTQNQDSETVDEEAYEILLYFVSEWLQYFSMHEKFFGDASGVLSAIVIMCMAQLTKSYFINKQVELAFLMYLNLFYFTEYITAKSYATDFGVSASQGQISEEQKISSKFRNMVGNWDFENLLDLDVIKTSAKNIELTMRRSHGEKMETRDAAFSGTLSDELVLEYLDMTDDLKEFLVEKINLVTAEAILELKELSLYKKPQLDGFSRLDRIGSICLKHSSKELPFPLIRNIHQMAVGMTIIPFDMGSDILSGKSLISSIKELLDMRDQ